MACRSHRFESYSSHTPVRGSVDQHITNIDTNILILIHMFTGTEDNNNGGVAERSKALVWKASCAAHTWVRIPSLPWLLSSHVPPGINNILIKPICATKEGHNKYSPGMLVHHLRNMHMNTLAIIKQLHAYHNIALVRKCYEPYMLTGKQKLGGCPFQVQMRKLIFSTLGGPLRRKAKKRNHVNQTITFSSTVAGCTVIFMCPVQFSAGFAS